MLLKTKYKKRCVTFVNVTFVVFTEIFCVNETCDNILRNFMLYYIKTAVIKIFRDFLLIHHIYILAIFGDSKLCQTTFPENCKSAIFVENNTGLSAEAKFKTLFEFYFVHIWATIQRSRFHCTP